MRLITALLLALLATCASAAPARARDLDVPLGGTAGHLNAITDVSGVTVGQVTLMQDLDGGRKVRTGVTAIMPRGAMSKSTPVFGAWFSLNSNGEMTGTAWIDESGQVEGPVLLTN